MSKKFFPVIQYPDRPVFKETIIFLNTRGGQDPKTGLNIPAQCLGIEPSAGMYVVDTDGEYAKEKMAVLEAEARKEHTPILGPFDSAKEAAMAEMKERPLTTEQELSVLRSKVKESAVKDAEIEALKKKLAEKDLMDMEGSKKK